jgi:transmembrane sensor
MSRSDSDQRREDDERLQCAVDWFLRVHSEQTRFEDVCDLDRWMKSDERNARVYREVSTTWQAVGVQAPAPELMAIRRDVLESAPAGARIGTLRKSGASRLIRGSRLAVAASIAALMLAAGLAWMMRPPSYATDVGERRTLTLADGSVITLDACSRIRVEFQKTQRLVALEQGQARFDVAKDPSRPFRVRVRNRTVIAVGTQFNVEIAHESVIVTMIEGRVAVTDVGTQTPETKPASAESRAPTGADAISEPSMSSIELRAGEELRIRPNGEAALVPHANLAHTMAWQAGKLFFDNEPLAIAAERVDRYARVRIEVDPSVAGLRVSGVFKEGDAAAFVEAVSAYFPVRARRIDAATVRLASMR